MLHNRFMTPYLNEEVVLQTQIHGMNEIICSVVQVANTHYSNHFQKYI